MIELPGVIESGMPRRNDQRKPGTTRGSPRRSRTAKALRISRHAVKSRCARGWGGWGRLSDDGSRQHNSDKSEDPWGGGLPHLHGGARSHTQPDTVRDYCGRFDVRERQTQTKHQSVYAGSRLKPAMRGKVLPYMPAFQPYRGKPAVRNDREGRGNIGIIRSPIRASTLPDCGGREVTRVPTAKGCFAAIAHSRLWHKCACPPRPAYDRSRTNTELTVEVLFIDAARLLFWPAAVRA